MTFRLNIKRATVIIIALMAIAGSVLGWKQMKPYLVLDNFGVVEPGKIYRSGQLLPFQFERVIAKYGIKTVIQANAFELSAAELAGEQTIFARHGVKMVPLLLWGDGHGGFDQYDKALDTLILSENLPALICCARGAYRTGAIVASYRVLAQKWPEEQAFVEMEKYKFDPHPRRHNYSEHRLLSYLRDYFHSRTNAVRQVEAGG